MGFEGIHADLSAIALNMADIRTNIKQIGRNDMPIEQLNSTLRFIV